MRITRAIAAILLLGAGCAQERESAPAEPPVQFQSASADLVGHGKRIADVLGCTGCHGADLTGEDWSEPGFGRLWTANLTRTVPALTDEQLAKMIRSGEGRGRALWEMPSHLFTHLTDEDMSALVLFLRSVPPRGNVHPEPRFDEGTRKEIESGTFLSSAEQVKREGAVWPPDAGKALGLGRYIVRATCAECHGLDLRGGQPNPAAVPRPDLRMAAAYDPQQFTKLLRTGIAAGDREVSLMSEVARGRYRHLTDAEIAAIHAYLRRLAEIDP